MMFLDCPAYLGGNGIVRCGLPAEVEARYTVRSTDGPLECAKIRCPRGRDHRRGWMPRTMRISRTPPSIWVDPSATKPCLR